MKVANQAATAVYNNVYRPPIVLEIVSWFSPFCTGKCRSFAWSRATQVPSLSSPLYYHAFIQE